MNSRRQVLAALGGGAITATAGCLGRIEDALESYPEELTIITDADDTPLYTETPECTHRGSGEVSITQSPVHANRANIEGVILTSDPCHEVEISDTEYDADDGTAIVRLTATSTDSDTCQQCLAEIFYTGAVEFEGGVPRALRIEHNSGADELTYEQEF